MNPLLTPLLVLQMTQPAAGIDRDMARERQALVREVTYSLAFELVEGAAEASGSARIRFRLAAGAPADAPLVLDFAGHGLSSLLVNGKRVAEPRRFHNHLLIARGSLADDWNTIEANFKTAVAPTGTPLTVFRDQARDEEFLYTLVVPADAHRLFPCFDQPDIKALVDLELTVPETWVATANGLETTPPAVTDGRKHYRFVTRHPLSTYLIAFAAGPFAVIEPEGATSEAPMRILVRPAKLDEVDHATLFEMHRQSVRWLGDFFGHAYPFGKLDIVLCPGFPYGGMEHAGAIFYRESALSFDHPPTESELRRRSTLIYHEVSHQWFGNLVTMGWFDDLWLKEGFATFVGYSALEALEPTSKAWLRFHQSVKPGAYRVDVTPGTTPVFQELHNLADAKSAYGAIVYNKAPAVLRELHERLGAAVFGRGVQQFLDQHQFANARWQDLVAALQDASEVDLGPWSQRWILAAGLPQVHVDWTADTDGKIAQFDVVQRAAQPDLQGGTDTWPLRIEVLLVGDDRSTRTVTIETSADRTAVPELIGLPAPRCVLLNPSDVAYGQFLLDPRSQSYLLEHIDELRNPLHRAVALTALFDSVREAELAPARYAELAIALLADERDPESHAWLLGTLRTTLARYLHDEARDSLAALLATTLLRQLERGAPGLELQTFRSLVRVSSSEAVLALCESELAGKGTIPGLTLGVQDRYLALAALIAAGQGGDWVDRMTGDNTPADAEKYAFLALAAAPDAATKARYFATYAQPDKPPEQWMQASLANFHWHDQEQLTTPYLRRALEQVDWVKTHRKIFFMPAWIAAFLGAHSGRADLDTVEEFLREYPRLSPDIRRKVLQSLDGLRRAVAIKERWK